jgi:hypothetical protein
MYPTIFSPTDTELFDLNGILQIPKCIVWFDRWTGKPITETFGRKPLVSLDEKPMFAELAIMTHFERDNWDVRWVETYGKSKPIYLKEWKDDKFRNQIHSPFTDTAIEKILADISKLNSNSYAGCWDVVACKEGRIVFAESKRAKRDKIRPSQKNCLAAGIKYGLQPDNFLIVQWAI